MIVKRYAEAPEAGPPLHDGGGLYLRRRDAGAYWYLRLTAPADGKVQWHRMFPDDPAGGYPHKTLAEARAEARRLWALRSQGLDPRAERARSIQARQASDAAAALEASRRVTIKQLFERWCQVDLQPHRRADGRRAGRKDGGKYIREQFERHVFPAIGDLAAADVRKTDLLPILDTQRAAGHLRTSNVLLANLRQMFAFALTRELVERNPLDTVSKRHAGGAETERQRVLSPAEIKRLAEAMMQAGLHERSVAAIWLLLATGARVGELMGAVWADGKGRNAALEGTADAHDVKVGYVDLAARTWYLPTTKNERDHTIHLSAFALRQFERLATVREPGPWVFPNSASSGPVCVKSFGKQLADRQRTPEQRLKGRSKATNSLALPGGRWTPHDLRRTAATLMAMLGISGDVIDECLNHMLESRLRRTYIQDRRVVEQARAFDALGAKLAELVEGSSQPSNVVVLQAA